jgi:uncharacterized protein (TIGR02246 family)
MSKTTIGFALALVVGLATPGRMEARQAAGKAAPKTVPAQDQVEIQQLVSRYAYAYDTGADNCYTYADLFTSDGEFVGTRGHAKGREALAEYCRGAHKPTIGVSHFIMNHVIDPSPDGAIGKQYLVVVSIGEDNKPGGEFTNTGGHYEDVYAKTSQGWRFKRREYIPIKSAPRPTQSAPSR